MTANVTTNMTTNVTDSSRNFTADEASDLANAIIFLILVFCVIFLMILSKSTEETRRNSLMISMTTLVSMVYLRANTSEARRSPGLEFVLLIISIITGTISIVRFKIDSDRDPNHSAKDN
ncbi:putative membrane protein [Wickerhamomyces ciferrii]|uniref:Membrane protein n=1 Tax=Wickerhamomyces ciferrii (strain ATCC 14091 / BCRC 22168 / CBS 111 / JCM 3599 / NBRC 0793 / NRRL Y-1031 F-60-10) TaxID=1206466 RepID=K0KW54_WICCF|nr:uncharacterized protein BN7_4945 [Wickerhamomyces ciferrii]CCH45363.1 putative membrane protein [Wickerhamomyces ciferrii]